ncbi:MAG: PKD domain-containing protein [Vicinamibacterales bacterium]
MLRVAIGTLLVLFCTVNMFGQNAPPGRPKPDLEGINLQFRSAVTGRPMIAMYQGDGRWAGVLVGSTEEEVIRKAGCTLTSLAMIANYFGLLTKANPLVEGWDPLLTSPVGIHTTLLRTKGYTGTASGTANGTGYCRMCLDWENGLAGAFYDPSLSTVGMRLVSHGAWPNGEDRVDADLKNLLPSLLWLKLNPDRPLETHAVVVVGWDVTTNSYLILDPLGNRIPGARAAAEMYGPDWYSKITQAFSVEVTGGGLYSSDMQLAIHSPVEAMVIDPLGRRTGFDPSSSLTVFEIPESRYSYQAWADPTGLTQTLDPTKELVVGSAAAGVYSFQLIGTGNGPFTLEFRSHSRSGLVLNELVSGSTAPGQVFKHEVIVAPDGGRVLRQNVSNFSPHAIAGGTTLQAVNLAATFTGARSFDPDGTVQSYAWDFGDGTSAIGVEASHAYSTAGAYTVVLTVTDNQGSSSSRQLDVSIFTPAAAPGAGTTQLVSVTPAGGQFVGPVLSSVMSADGRFVAFRTGIIFNSADFTFPQTDAIWVRDVTTGITEAAPIAVPLTQNLLNPAEPLERTGHRIAISADGSVVAFEASAALVSGDTNGLPDIYVWNRQLGTIVRASVDNSGAQLSLDSLNVALSGDGRFVAFDSRPSNQDNTLRNVYVRDLQAGTTELVSVAPSPNPTCYGACNHSPALSHDGRFVVWESPASNLVSPGTNGLFHIFLRDRLTGVTEVVSRNSAGVLASNASYGASISADGRSVAFESDATNLVTGDTNGIRDIFVRDRALSTTERVSVSSAGAQSVQGANFSAAISTSGQFVVFNSTSANLVPNDTNGLRDVFLRDRDSGTTERVNIAQNTAQACCSSDFNWDNLGNTPFFDTQPAVSTNGGVVAFNSNVSNLTPPDTNGLWTDTFVRIRNGGQPVARPSGPYLGWASTVASPAYVTFVASRAIDPAGSALLATWNFGDGSPAITSSAGQPFQHSYASAGRYTVTLTVSNGVADSSPQTTTADILAPSAITLSAAPTCFDPGASVLLTSAGHAVVSPMGGWNLEDGPIPNIDVGALGNVFRLAVDGPSGSLSERLIPITSVFASTGLEFAVNAQGVVGFDFVPGNYVLRSMFGSTGVQVPCPAPSNHIPQANSGGPYLGSTGQPLIFDGSRSSDADGDALVFSWDFGDGSQGTGVAPTHTYAAPGQYYVALTVHDGQAESPSTIGTHAITLVTVTETVTNTAPTFSHADMTTSATGAGGATVTFTASGSDAEEGSIPAVCTPSSASTFTIGTTTVHCTVTDSGGLTAFGSFTVTVTDTAPTFTPPANIATTATSAAGVAVTYTTPTATDFKDGIVPVACTPPSGSTVALGTTTVTCTATNSAGMTTTHTFTITVTLTGPACSGDDDHESEHHKGDGRHFHGDRDDDHDCDHDRDGDGREHDTDGGDRNRRDIDRQRDERRR